MAKQLKLIGIVLLLLLGFGGASLYYFWQEATKLPEWYVNKPTHDLGNANTNVIADQIKQKIKAQTEHSQPSGKAANVELNLTSAELNQVVTEKLAEKAHQSNLNQAIKGIDTQIAGDQLKTGAVVDLANLKTSNMSDREKTLLNEVTQKFPALANREVYIGIEGKPQIDKGRLKFDSQTKVQVGKLSFTVPELADRLGIPEATLLEKINLNLNLNGLTIEAIELKAGNAVLKGATH
jgi:hypothetical protein